MGGSLRVTVRVLRSLLRAIFMSLSRAFLMDTLPTSACVSAHACVSRSLFMSEGKQKKKEIKTHLCVRSLSVL